MSYTFRLLLFSFFLYSTSLYSQSNRTGTWAGATIVLPSNAENRFGAFAEAQVRTDEVLLKKIFYHEFKGGISYAIDNNYVALLGAGRYTTYDYLDLDKDPLSKENRVWEQLTFSQYLKRIKFEHRYRAEQRWINKSFHNRFRYRLNAVLPINHSKMEKNTLFVSVFDEIFLSDEQPHFLRNRVGVSVGYRFAPSLTIQSGWLYQYNNTLIGTNAKHNILLNLVYQINRKKPSLRENLPTLSD